MKIYVKVETGTGGHIVEIEREEVLRNILAQPNLDTAVADLEQITSSAILSPIRGMFRAKVREMQEERGFSRLRMPGAPGTEVELNANTDALVAYLEKARHLAGQ